MTDRPMEIKGGASEFEAAIIAVVLDQIAREEAAARQGKRRRGNELPAWIRAVQPERPLPPRDLVRPDD